VEVEEISMVVPQMVLSIPIFLSSINLNLAKQGLQVFSKDFRDRLKDHNVKSVERMDMGLLIVITGWILLFKASMLHQSLLQWQPILLRFMELMIGLQIQAVLIMWHLILLIFPCNNNLLQVLRLWLLGMAKSCLLLMLAMVNYVLHLIPLSLMVYLGFLIFLQIFCLSISFVYKTMHSAILMLIDSLSRI